VRYHRRRFDGGGDPAAPRGEAIPLEARIVAVAATYVHLARGPRAGAERAAVRDALLAEAGGALDPALVQKALRLLPGGALAA